MCTIDDIYSLVTDGRTLMVAAVNEDGLPYSATVFDLAEDDLPDWVPRRMRSSSSLRQGAGAIEWICSYCWEEFLFWGQVQEHLDLLNLTDLGPDHKE
jgi:hypothetical protein